MITTSTAAPTCSVMPPRAVRADRRPSARTAGRPGSPRAPSRHPGRRRGTHASGGRARSRRRRRRMRAGATTWRGRASPQDGRAVARAPLAVRMGSARPCYRVLEGAGGALPAAICGVGEGRCRVLGWLRGNPDPLGRKEIPTSRHPPSPGIILRAPDGLQRSTQIGDGDSPVGVSGGSVAPSMRGAARRSLSEGDGCVADLPCQSCGFRPVPRDG